MGDRCAWEIANNQDINYSANTTNASFSTSYINPANEIDELLAKIEKSLEDRNIYDVLLTMTNVLYILRDNAFPED